MGVHSVVVTHRPDDLENVLKIRLQLPDVTHRPDDLENHYLKKI